MAGDIVQVIADVLACVDRDRLAAYLHDSYGPEDTDAAVESVYAQLDALRDLIVEDRKAKVAWIVSESSRDFLAARDTERALLAFCREVGP